MRKHAQMDMGMSPSDSIGNPLDSLGVGGPVQGAGQPLEEDKDYTALTSPDDVLKDYGLQEKIGEEVPVKKIVQEIWQMYGGSYLGEGADRGKFGKRTIKSKEEDTRQQPAKDQEIEATEDKRWERLQDGKYITDIFPDTQSLTRAITNVMKATSAQEGGQSPAGGGGFGLAKSTSWYRYAKTARAGK